jgi:hypothetical protein
LTVGASVGAGASAIGAGHHASRIAVQKTARHSGVVSVAGSNGVATNESNNWSGYNQGALERKKTFHAITATWVVPTATQHTAGQAEFSASWIGIGGGCVNAGCTVTDSTLIQTGTEQDVAANGTASYDAWYELIPAPELEVKTVAIHPGDTIKASITKGTGEIWTVKLSDVTDGQGFSKTVPYSSTMDSAEWIEETPLEIGVHAGLAALPNLSTVHFTQTTVNGASAGLKASEELDLIDSGGSVIMAPSAPAPKADAFNVCSYATTCGAPTSG